MTRIRLTIRLPERVLELLGGATEAEIEAFLRRQLAIELCSRGVNSHEACELLRVDHDALVREIIRANRDLLDATPDELQQRLAKAQQIRAAYERRADPE